MELLKIEGLEKTIKKRKILKGFSLTVNAGEIVGFLGPNGAGKTTTIKMILGLFSITAGRISICGHDIVRDFTRAMANVGGIVENPDLYKRLSGRENLAYFSSMHAGVSKDNIDEVVKLVKMADRIDDKVKTYSLGMCQRIGIAQALLHNPRLLVLDEPTNGLDPLGIKELRDLLQYLARHAGVGVFISSHLLAEMELMCDRIYIIDNGAMIGEKAINNKDVIDGLFHDYVLDASDQAKAQALLQDMGLASTLTDEGIGFSARREDIPGLVKKLVEQGTDIFAVNQKHHSLEQDFLSMTVGSKGQIE